MRILPAILAHSMDEFTLKVERVRPLGQPLHIDVMDGKFVDNTTWARPQEVHDIMKGLEFEVHLMVNEPRKTIGLWRNAGAARIFFHLHTDPDPGEILDVAHDGCHIGFAVSPDMMAEATPTLFEKTHLCLVMGVEPGWGGQEFIPETLEKIRLLKAMAGNVDVTVDGGVSLKTIAAIKEAGADAVVMGSALTDADDVRTVWDALEPFRN